MSLWFRATYIVENDEWTVYAADGVVSYSRRHRNHAGVHYFRHDGGGERFVGYVVSLGIDSRAAVGL